MTGTRPRKAFAHVRREINGQKFIFTQHPLGIRIKRMHQRGPGLFLSHTAALDTAIALSEQPEMISRGDGSPGGTQ